MAFSGKSLKTMAAPICRVCRGNVQGRSMASAYARRSMATESTGAQAASSAAEVYPFSSAVSTSTASPVPSSILARLQKPSKGKSVVDHINASLTAAYDPAQHLTRTFGRRHPLRAKPGSVIVVSSYNDASRTTSSSFGGVLLGVRRRGVDTAFTLRNIVNKTGVEVAFKVCSPLVKSISVVKHANGKKGGLRDLGRAKVNYLRERPGLMNQIAAAMKAPAGGAAAGKGAKPPPGKPGKPVKAA